MFLFELSGFNNVYNYANIRLRRVYYPIYNKDTKEYEIKDIDFYNTEHVLYSDDSTYIGWNNVKSSKVTSNIIDSDPVVQWRNK